MRIQQKKTIVGIIILLIATVSALSYSKIPAQSPVKDATPSDSSLLMITGELSREKIAQHGDGTVSLALNLSTAEQTVPAPIDERSGINFIVVIDRSGSMEGDKIKHAKNAIKEITSSLLPIDKLGLVSYSDAVRTDFPLAPLTPSNRKTLQQSLDAVFAGGGTNLGAGLYQSLELTDHKSDSNQTKIILISDGMANQGITDPQSLAQLAHKAVSLEASLSTVGVGLDFNEYLMTTIADHGGGSYHFLENPEAFGATFKRELLHTTTASVAGIEVFIPEMKDIALIDASGYPLEKVQGGFIVRPGNIMPGNSRKLFLTFKAPTSTPGDYQIQGVKVRYTHLGTSHVASLEDNFQLSCVKNEEAATASINKGVWREKVMQDDLNKLRGQVAQEVKEGKREAALKHLEEYKIQNESVNRTVSEQVATEAEEEIASLTEQVNETFEGSSTEISRKQKKVSKTLQYQGYEGRRNLKR